MTVRYLLIVSGSEGIHCIGDRPFVGDTIRVKKNYGSREEAMYRVTDVRHSQLVEDHPYDHKGARGNQCHSLLEVYVQPIV